MNKKRILIGTLVILGLSFLFHSVYDKFPSTITSLLFPVNESIWEHNKMITLAFLVWTILEKIFHKSGKSTIFINLISLILCILILNTSFGIVYFYILKKKENLIITIIMYAISIILSFLLGERFLIEENTKTETIGTVGFIFLFIMLGVLTYKPLELPLFYDYKHEAYGIPNYNQ